MTRMFHHNQWRMVWILVALMGSSHVTASAAALYSMKDLGTVKVEWSPFYEYNPNSIVHVDNNGSIGHGIYVQNNGYSVSNVYQYESYEGTRSFVAKKGGKCYRN